MHLCSNSYQLINIGLLVIDALEQNCDLVVAVSTGVIALFAILTFCVTWFLARENRLLRKGGTEPKVVAYLTPELGSYVPHINLVIANIGQGPAQDVAYWIDAKEEDFTKYEILFLKHDARVKIAFLPQGECIRATLGNHELLGVKSGGGDPKGPALPPFNVTVRYKNLTGKSFSCTHRMDVSSFSRMGAPFVEPEHEIAETLKEIEKHLRHFVSYCKRLLR